MDSNFETTEKHVDEELEVDELVYMHDLLSTDPDMKCDYNLYMEINKAILEHSYQN